MASVKVAAGFIIYRRIQAEIQYLLLHAQYRDHTCWTPPKGHVDPGESEIETAYRETEEEAGLKKEQLKFVDGFERVMHYEAWGKPKKVIYWLSELKDPSTPVKISHEHIGFNWFNIENALKESSRYTDMQETLQAADDYIRTAT